MICLSIYIPPCSIQLYSCVLCTIYYTACSSLMVTTSDFQPGRLGLSSSRDHYSMRLRFEKQLFQSLYFFLRKSSFLRKYITSHHITSHHIASHRIASHRIASHQITSHHITSHHITSHHITSHHITLHYITLHYITLLHITSHYFTLLHITLHYITLHYITLH